MWTSGGPTNPLDRDLGAGHLNVKRAIDQLAPGEYDGGNVPLIGWDYGSTGPGGQNGYALNAGLTANKYIAVTLAWDRINEKNEDGPYTGTDTFFGGPVNDLNLYLMEADETDINNAVARSISPDDTIEHIFFKDFPAGNYKIVVQHNGDSGGGSGTDIDYALAWWHGQDTLPFIPGDFDSDGDVDEDDLPDWEDSFGLDGGADADNDSDSDGADFLAWQRNLGTGVPAMPANAAVPEPAAWPLVAAGLPLWLCRRTG